MECDGQGHLLQKMESWCILADGNGNRVCGGPLSAVAEGEAVAYVPGAEVAGARLAVVLLRGTGELVVCVKARSCGDRLIFLPVPLDVEPIVDGEGVRVGDVVAVLRADLARPLAAALGTPPVCDGLGPGGERPEKHHDNGE